MTACWEERPGLGGGCDAAMRHHIYIYMYIYIYMIIYVYVYIYMCTHLMNNLQSDDLVDVMHSVVREILEFRRGLWGLNLGVGGSGRVRGRWRSGGVAAAVVV